MAAGGSGAAPRGMDDESVVTDCPDGSYIVRYAPTDVEREAVNGLAANPNVAYLYGLVAADPEADDITETEWMLDLVLAARSAREFADLVSRIAGAAERSGGYDHVRMMRGVDAIKCASPHQDAGAMLDRFSAAERASMERAARDTRIAGMRPILERDLGRKLTATEWTCRAWKISNNAGLLGFMERRMGAGQ